MYTGTLDQAFNLVDSDGNGVIDANEIQGLLEQVYIATYGNGKKMQQERNNNNFFKSFGKTEELTKEHFIIRLTILFF